MSKYDGTYKTALVVNGQEFPVTNLRHYELKFPLNGVPELHLKYLVKDLRNVEVQCPKPIQKPSLSE